MAARLPKAFHDGASQVPTELAGKPALTSAPERVLVLWGEPEHGTRRVIGELWRDPQGFAFGYGHELDLAIQKGFRLLPEFPLFRGLEAPYRSPYLFGTFAQRIPSPKRADYQRILESWGVQAGDSQLEILARSGGVQLTDRIELAEHRSEDDPLERPLIVRVAGMKHYTGDAQIAERDPLVLKREPHNAHDTHATAIFTEGGFQVGYVPRQYAKPVARLLDEHAPLSKHPADGTWRC